MQVQAGVQCRGRHLGDRQPAFAFGADHPGAAQPVLADLELRLDHQHQVPAGLGTGREGRHHEGQRDEGEVRHGQCGRAADLFRGHVAHVQAFVDRDPRVVPDLRHQLVMPDVDGHHVSCAAPQQHLGEAAGGGAGVEAAFAGDLDGGKGVQRARELVGRPTDVVILARGRDVEDHAVLYLQGGLGQHFATGADLALADQARSVGAGPRQTAADEGLIKPGHGRGSPAGWPATSSLRASTKPSCRPA